DPSGPPVPCRPPGAYLLDPSPAVTRAGLVEELARELGAWKLGPPIAFLSPHQPLHTPFGRLLRVDASLPWNLKRLRQALRERGVGAVEVRKRGSAGDVAELSTPPGAGGAGCGGGGATPAPRLRVGGGPPPGAVLTRVAGRPWALVCTEQR